MLPRAGSVTALPVDAVLERIRAACALGNVVVLAPPGSGKTTRVPCALSGRVRVVEPRRLAARMAATWVARERGGQVGDEVGYQVRFDARVGPSTRVQFVTDGVMMRQLIEDPELRDVDVVVIDEFHERRLNTDLALAWLRRLQATARPDLRIVVMSATFDPGPVAAWLSGAEVVETSGRQFDVRVEYAHVDDRPLDSRVAAAVRGALDADAGDVLVFLPGAAEIRRCMEACAASLADRGVDARPLHGDLSLEQQAAAITPGARRRVVFATNVAESSLTVEGVTTVIDSGLVRRVRTLPWSGLEEVRVEKVSRASADQRAGRAGRVRPGRCVRLYASHDYVHRIANEAPEIGSADLSEMVLMLRGAGVADVRSLPWLDAPPSVALAQAEALLARLGAFEGEAISALGRRMLALPLSPRLARLALEAERLGAVDDGRLAAAILSEGDPRRDARTRFGSGERARRVRSGPSDVLAMVEAYRARHDLDTRVAKRIEALDRQLRRWLAPVSSGGGDDALQRAVLAAWPDRVARRRRRDGAFELLLSGGGTARLSEASEVSEADLVVCVDAEERAGGTLVRVASEIEASWLLDLCIDHVHETDERRWNAKSERVELVRSLMYDRLVLDETRVNPPRDAATAAVLGEAARAVGVRAFTDVESVEGYLNRVAFAATLMPPEERPLLGEAALIDVLEALCDGCLSFDEVREAAGRGGFLACLEQRLAPQARRQVDRLAPTHVQLPSRRVAVCYEAERLPYIASRLQDFFGLREGPRVGDGQAPLVLHLLAPNQRPVQITTDLAGFWVRTYPSVRRELSRRYPRHAWPEDPTRLGG